MTKAEFEYAARFTLSEKEWNCVRFLVNAGLLSDDSAVAAEKVAAKGMPFIRTMARVVQANDVPEGMAAEEWLGKCIETWKSEDVAADFEEMYAAYCCQFMGDLRRQTVELAPMVKESKVLTGLLVGWYTERQKYRDDIVREVYAALAQKDYCAECDGRDAMEYAVLLGRELRERAKRN